MKLHASISDVNSASLRMRGGGIALDRGKALRSKTSVCQVLVESAEHAVTDRAAVGGATERQDEVQHHRPGGGCTQLRSLDVANESPQRAGLLVEGVAEGAAQLDVALDLVVEEMRRRRSCGASRKGERDLSELRGRDLHVQRRCVDVSVP